LSAPEKIIVGAVDAVIKASGCGGGADNSAGIGFLETLGCAGIRMVESLSEATGPVCLGFCDALGVLRKEGIRTVESSSVLTDSVGAGAACKGAPHRVQNLGSRVPRSALQDVQNINYLPLNPCTRYACIFAGSTIYHHNKTYYPTSIFR
jgi:hypothetical protein